MYTQRQKFPKASPSAPEECFSNTPPRESEGTKEAHMRAQETTKASTDRTLIKKCHCCGTIMETHREPQRCTGCGKSFLPTQYFGKVHAKNEAEFKELFSSACELEEEVLIKGLTLIW